MADRGWKKAERMIAKDCGGQRIPVTGERAGSDVDHSLFAFQVKVRRALPSWLFDWLGGIVANATKRGKIGVLIINRPRQPRRNALVILRWQDWCDLHGNLSASERDQRALAIGRRSLEREEQIAEAMGDGSWLDGASPIAREGGGQ